jgi:hypothetical protein
MAKLALEQRKYKSSYIVLAIPVEHLYSNKRGVSP